MKNNKGPIAETYIELQALPLLHLASQSYPTKRCTRVSTIKTILQAIEIGIQNLNDLLERIVIDIQNKEIENATTKLAWFKDINYLLVKVTNLINIISLEPLSTKSNNNFKIESQTKLQSMFIIFDHTISTYLKDNSINLSNILEVQNINDNLYKFLHIYRITAFDITIWNKNIVYYSIPNDTNYDRFIGINEITKAVNEPKLTGDTFFTQFRCLHQIPELLTAELNNYIEYSILSLRKDDISKAHKKLRIANVLLEITIDSLKPITDNLSHNDYHKIRENLGLTSGSHSINLHFHLFRDLYSAITLEYMTKYFKNKKTYKKKISENYILKLFEIEILKLRNSVNQWRNLHLHLPRVNLGENQTKSLIGAKEAVESAKKMQFVANSKDLLNRLVNLYSHNVVPSNLPFLEYIESSQSFDSKLGNELGNITQKRFINVQNREGFFSNSTIFKNPEKRNL